MTDAEQDPGMPRARTVVVVLLVAAGALLWWLRSPGEAERSAGEPVARVAPPQPGGPLLEGGPATASTAQPPSSGPAAPAEPKADAAADPAQGGWIEGTVIDWEGKPATGMAILLVAPDDPAPPRGKGGMWDPAAFGRETIQTDAAGHYRLPLTKEPGPGVVVVRASDTYEVRSPPVLPTALRQRVDVRVPPPATLRVRLASQAGERPRLSQLGVQGEFVWFSLRPVEDEEMRSPWDLQVSEDGSVVTARATPGNVKVQAWTQNAPMVEREATLVAGEVTDVLIEVPGDGVVEGRIVIPADRTLGDATVMWEGQRNVMGEAAKDGRFRLVGVGPARGKLRVHAFLEDLGFRQGSRENVEPDGEPIEIRLESNPTVTVRVEGLPPDANLTYAVMSKGVTSHSRGPLSAHGSVVLQPRPAEPALVVLLDPTGANHAPIVIDVPALEEGEEKDLGTVRFGPGIEVRGRVVDGSGAPVSGIEVAVAEKWSDLETRTDTVGRFHLPRMPTRPFLLRTLGAGFPQHLVTVDPVASPAPQVVVTPGGRVAVAVVDTEGRGVPGADLTVLPVGDFPYDQDFDKTRRHFTVGPEGKAEVRMCAGPRRLRAYAKGKPRSEDVDITVREGATTDVTLVLREKPAR